MRIVQVVSHVGGEASGPTYAVPRLSRVVAEQGDDVLLLSLKDGLLPSGGRFTHQILPVDRFPSALWPSSALRASMLQHCADADVLHSHGLWLMPNRYAGQIAVRTGIAHVLSPHGTLSEWAFRRSAFRKKIAWAAFQRSAVMNATCIHATADSEYEDARRVGCKQPVAVVPLGIDIPTVAKDWTVGEFPDADRRVILFLGRIHPKKGIDVLIRAWSDVAPGAPNWVLRIVGPDDGGYLNSMRALAATLRVPRIEFPGPAFGEAKQDEYRCASLFVLPTHSENFGLTVAESLAIGTPVVVTHGAPWSGVERERCGWWIEYGVAPLANALREGIHRDAHALHEMGRRGREWMARDFSWPAIGDRMRALYQWTRFGGVAPPFVRVD